MKWWLCLLATGLVLAEEPVKLPGLTIDPAQKTVTATGKVSLTNDILEFLACEPAGRDYESLVTLDCKPSALKFALLLVGCSAGETNGSPLTIEVGWTSAGKERRVGVETWLIDRTTGQPPTKPLPFFLNGSFFGKDLFTTNQIFHADVEQAHIAMLWMPAILINLQGNPGNPYQSDHDGYEANPKAVPPKGTPIQLIFRKRDAR